MTKMTKVEKFNAIREFLDTVDNDFGFDVQEFLTHEVELISKKAGSKNSKKSAENESIKSLILDVVTSDNQTATEIMKAVNEKNKTDYSIQKITVLLGQLVKAEKVTRTQIKKDTFFTLA